MHRPGVVALVIGGFGLAVLAIVVSSLREAAAMKCWPVAKGRVLSAKVEKYRQSVSRGTGGPRDRMTLYRPVLLYEYEVAGKRFRGSRIAQSPGLDRGVPEFAEKVVDRYPGGSAVAVRYNPRRPDESVLEPRVPRSWIFGAAIGVALLVLAAYIYHRGRWGAGPSGFDRSGFGGFRILFVHEWDVVGRDDSRDVADHGACNPFNRLPSRPLLSV